MWKPKKEYAFSSQLSNYIPIPFRKEVFNRDGQHCQFCNSTEKLGLSHLIPKSRGGKTIPENLVVSCYTCRNAKHTRLPLEFISEQIFEQELEKLDILGEMIMQVKVIYRDGTSETGEIEEMPDVKDQGFYLRKKENGNSPEFISISAIKKIVPTKARPVT